MQGHLCFSLESRGHSTQRQAIKSKGHLGTQPRLPHLQFSFREGKSRRRKEPEKTRVFISFYKSSNSLKWNWGWASSHSNCKGQNPIVHCTAWLLDKSVRGRTSLCSAPVIEWRQDTCHSRPPASRKQLAAFICLIKPGSETNPLYPVSQSPVAENMPLIRARAHSGSAQLSCTLVLQGRKVTMYFFRQTKCG